MAVVLSVSVADRGRGPAKTHGQAHGGWSAGNVDTER
jgi:hypothetical protein